MAEDPNRLAILFKLGTTLLRKTLEGGPRPTLEVNDRCAGRQSIRDAILGKLPVCLTRTLSIEENVTP